MTASTLLLPSVDFRASTRARDAALIVGGSLFLALAAQARIHLPFTPVPITGQTLAVGVLGLTLGSRRGAATAALYVAAGALGAPVFAGLAGGLAALLGVTGGYLIAMPLAAFLTGFLAERGWDRRPLGAFAAVLVGSSLVLSCGTLWLAAFVHGLAHAVTVGLLPFLPGELIKAAVAAGAFPTLWGLKRREPT